MAKTSKGKSTKKTKTSSKTAKRLVTAKRPAGANRSVAGAVHNGSASIHGGSVAAIHELPLPNRHELTPNRYELPLQPNDLPLPGVSPSPNVSLFSTTFWFSLWICLWMSLPYIPRLLVLFVLFPLLGIVINVTTDSFQFIIGSDDMLVIVSLPHGYARRIQQLIDRLGGIHFEISNHLR